MDFLETWTNYKSLLAIAKNHDEDAVRKFLGQIRLPTENLTNSASLSKLFALTLDIQNFEALEILLKHGVRAMPNQETADYTVLQSAVLSGNVTLISEVIEHGADYNVVDKNGNSLLHLAFKSSTYDWHSTGVFDNTIQRDEAEKLIIDIFDILVGSGLDVNVKNQNGETPLSLAVERRNVKITDYLVKRNAELNVFGKTLSFYLVQDETKASDRLDESCKNQRNMDFMDWWFSKKLDLDRKCSGITPLQLAVRHMLKHILLILINYTDKIDSIDDNGGTLLHTLFYSVLCLSKKERNNNHSDRCIEIVKILMDKGVSVNHADKNRNTPFHIAARLNNPKPMQMMLKSFTSVNACDSAKQTVLSSVIKNCTEKYQDQYLLIVSALVTKGADMNSQDHSGMSALHHACANNTKASKAIVEFFADQGCDLNVANDKGWTPLHLCIKKDRVDLFKTLIDHGADVNCKFTDKNRKITALHKATEEQLPEFIEMLIKAGADPDAKDEEGNTALHMELASGKGIVMSKLLEMGADPNLRGKDNWSPLRQALYRAYPLGVRRLLLYGATVSDINRSMLIISPTSLREQVTAKGLVVLHLASLKAAGFSVPADYDRIVRPIQEILESSNEARTSELEKLKNTRIDGIVIYDFLHMNLKLRFCYSRRADFKKFLTDYKALKRDFPVYCDIIWSKYWMAVTRMPLVNSARDAWYRMTDVYLPEICIECIFSYLRNSELRLVIKAGA